MTIFGRPHEHREYATQIAGEQLQEVLETSKGEQVYVWKTAPGRHDFGDTGAMRFALGAKMGIGSSVHNSKAVPVKNAVRKMAAVRAAPTKRRLARAW